MSDRRTEDDSNRDIAHALRGLPPVTPDSLAVARWQRAAQAQTPVAPAARWWPVPAMLAASVVLAIGAWRVASMNSDVSDTPQRTAQTQTAQPTQQLPAYVAQTALLTQVLANMPSEGRVLSVARASAIATLEDQLALLDSAIRNPPTAVSHAMHSQLWRERVGVMSTLVTLKQRNDGSVYL